MRRRALLAAVAGGALLAVSVPASAGGFSADEQARLLRGEILRRHVDFETEDGPYFGGLAYGVIDASPAEVMNVLLDVGAYRAILPLTLEAKEVGRKGDNKLVFFRHGGRVGSAGYTAIVRRESPSVLRFWLDPEYPHEVEDCWGYFRVEAMAEGKKTLLTYGAVLRLEFGFIRMFFSEKIRSFALSTPLRVRSYFQARAKGR